MKVGMYFASDSSELVEKKDYGPGIKVNDIIRSVSSLFYNPVKISSSPQLPESSRHHSDSLRRDKGLGGAVLN